jgi:small subunit ribosomal protein S17
MAEAKSRAEGVRRRGLTGTVTSTRGDKTIHVVVENLVKEPAYGKYVRRRTKLAAHDPQKAASLGDVVEVVPCRRISKTKCWRLSRVVRAAGAQSTEIQEV